jgi:hypothetical protein
VKVVIVYISLVIAATIFGSVTGDFIQHKYEVNR